MLGKLIRLHATLGNQRAATHRQEQLRQLPLLAEEPRAGYNNPFFIYLTTYRVLAATGDSRAAALLQKGYGLLQQDAAALDEESRHRFLTTVPIHRALVAAYDEQLI